MSCDNPVQILDGGFSTQLSLHVNATSDGDPLWTARYLQTHPEDVVKTHLDFLRAGSDIISTNTYQASIGGFVKHLGVTPEEAYDIIKRAVGLAQRARSIYLSECKNPPNNKPMIAASIGPYGAHLNDGSEYDGHYAGRTSMEMMREWHLPRIKAVLESGVDYLAFETIPCEKEAEVLVELLKEYPTAKAWLSFSCKDGSKLANGENFQTVAKKCWDANPHQLLGIGVNCCSPLIVGQLFKGINDDRTESPLPLLSYPNSGEKYVVSEGWVDSDRCASLDYYVNEWLDMGVRYVGGCCRTKASDIANIRAKVQRWSKKTTV